jgi:hypothetical protein
MGSAFRKAFATQQFLQRAVQDMKALRTIGLVLMGWVWLGVMALLAVPSNASAASEERFDMLQIGSRTYRNVTVTTKARNYVFLMHSEGLANIKVADLSPEVAKKLGYGLPAAKSGTKLGTNVAAFAKQTIGKLETPQIKHIEQDLVNTWNDQSASARQHLPPLTPTFLLGVAAGFVLLYLLYCYCCMLICRKAGHQPGALVWVPVLQAFPMLKAAGMSYWWFLAYFVPLLNLVAHILWCFKISDVRGKTPLIAVLLLLPVLNILAFFYLALSGGEGAEPVRQERRVEIMTLETA